MCVIMSSVWHQMQIKTMLGQHMQDLADGMVICCLLKLWLSCFFCFFELKQLNHTWSWNHILYIKFKYDFNRSWYAGSRQWKYECGGIPISFQYLGCHESMSPNFGILSYISLTWTIDDSKKSYFDRLLCLLDVMYKIWAMTLLAFLETRRWLMLIRILWGFKLQKFDRNMVLK